MPDTESLIEIADDGVSIKKQDIKWVMNPYDENAVEEATGIKRDVGDAEVIAVTLGSQAAEVTLQPVDKIGIDAAIMTRSVDIMISRLRSKIGDAVKPPRFIQTIWGRGYSFVGVPKTNA